MIPHVLLQCRVFLMQCSFLSLLAERMRVQKLPYTSHRAGLPRASLLIRPRLSQTLPRAATALQ